MTKRLEELYSVLLPCKKFADVGCDHGYIAKAMIIGGKAEEVVVSDISAPSLKKAERLLSSIEGARFKAVVCDGLDGVDDDCDQVLIAGMGGEEIIAILGKAVFLPERLVLQPMKNVDKLRKSLLLLGYRIERDYIFKDEKFYNVIAAIRGNDSYTEDELFFGRDNLRERGENFLEFALRERDKYAALLATQLPDTARTEIARLKEKYEGVLSL